MAIRLSDIHAAVDEMTATDAARAFRALLDRVERDGESFRITRHGRAVAELGPVRSSTLGTLLDRVRDDPPDAEWWDDIRWIRDLPDRMPAP